MTFVLQKTIVRSSRSVRMRRLTMSIFSSGGQVMEYCVMSGRLSVSAGHGDLHLVALVHPRDRHDLLRDGGGEQAEIAAVFDLLDDLRHVVEEAHVEHPVRLVEHDGLHLVERRSYCGL